MLFFVKTALLVMPVFFIDSLYIKVTCKYKLATFLFFLLFVIVISLLFRTDPIQFNSIFRIVMLDKKNYLAEFERIRRTTGHH